MRLQINGADLQGEGNVLKVVNQDGKILSKIASHFSSKSMRS